MKRFSSTAFRFGFIIWLVTLTCDQHIRAHLLNMELCSPQPLTTLEISPEAGELIYVDEEEHVLSTMRQFVPELPYSPSWRISPDGGQLAGLYYENDTDTEFIFVLNRVGTLVYFGAPSQDSVIDVRWLGSDRLLSFVTFATARTPSMRSILGFGYFIIDFFNREYTYTRPDREPPFYLYGDWFFVGGHNFTYDGRFLFNRDRGVFDFEAQQPLELRNFRWGIPSTTSDKLLVIEYNADDYYLQTAGNDLHPIFTYDFPNDTITQVTTHSAERPADIYENSWSPDETQWTYTLNYFDDVSAFRRVEVVDLETGSITPTCLGQFFQIKEISTTGAFHASGFIFPDFAWSRDSRYLALQGVLEGQDMEESLGVYIYDTQTDEIYEVYKGRADIIGWMANP